MEAGVKRKKKKTKRVERGTKRGRQAEKDGRQDAGERSEVSNGCEYIAVINFAKSRRRGRKIRKGSRSLGPVLVAELISCRTKEKGEKSQRKALI